MRPDSVLAGCSAAKLVTALVVLRLVQLDVLDLDADIRDWGLDLPRAAEAGTAPVTLRLLLAHRAGIHDPAGSFSPLGAAAPPTMDELIMGRSTAHPGPVSITDAPGLEILYSDAGYAVVEAVIERATGLDFAEAVHGLVAHPLALRSLSVWDAVDRPTRDAGLAHVHRRIRGAAVQSHGSDGAALPGGRAHYPGRGGSCLWSSAQDLATLMADLARVLRDGRDSVLLTAQSGLALLDGGRPGAGLGLYRLGREPAEGVLTQGWGVGAQCQARAYPEGSVVVMVNANPGRSQQESGVALLARQLAAAAGWATPLPES